MTGKRGFRSSALLLAPLAALGMGLAFAGGLAASPLAHKGQVSGFSIYRGDSKEVSGITWDSWGSGKAQEDAKVFYSGSHSIQVVTHGLYQGVTLDLARPANLGAYTADKTAYLQFVIVVAQAAKAGAGGPGGGPPGGAGGFGGHFGGGRGGAGASHSGGPASVKTKQEKAMENLRVLLITTDNQTLEFMLPLQVATEDNQWKLLSIPVSMIPGIKPDTQIKSIRLFGDEPATFYLGQIRVVLDATPITVDRIDSLAIPRNDKHDFVGKGAGGYTPLKYSWDWNSADGIQDEGEGRAINHTFHKTGDFVVTLTVSDAYGIKPPATTKFTVTVTP